MTSSDSTSIWFRVSGGFLATRRWSWAGPGSSRPAVFWSRCTHWDLTFSVPPRRGDRRLRLLYARIHRGRVRPAVYPWDCVPPESIANDGNLCHRQRPCDDCSRRGEYVRSPSVRGVRAGDGSQSNRIGVDAKNGRARSSLFLSQDAFNAPREGEHHHEANCTTGEVPLPRLARWPPGQETSRQSSGHAQSVVDRRVRQKQEP